MIYAFLKSAFALAGRRLVCVFTQGAAPGYALVRLSACYSYGFAIPTKTKFLPYKRDSTAYVNTKLLFGEEDFAVKINIRNHTTKDISQRDKTPMC